MVIEMVIALNPSSIVSFCQTKMNNLYGDRMGISCSIYDQLELAAMRSQTVLLTMRCESGQKEQIKCVIKDLITRDGKEYLITQQQEVIELDKLISINILAKH